VDASDTPLGAGVDSGAHQIHQFVGEVVTIGIDGGKPVQFLALRQPLHAQSQGMELASICRSHNEVHTMASRQLIRLGSATVLPIDGKTDGLGVVYGGDTGSHIVIE
jgi:hypothetical protein